MKSNGVDFEHTGSGQKAGELTPDVIKGRVPTATWAGATVGEHKTVSRSRRVQTVQLTGSRILGLSLKAMGIFETCQARQ